MNIKSLFNNSLHPAISRFHHKSRYFWNWYISIPKSGNRKPMLKHSWTKLDYHLNGYYLPSLGNGILFFGAYQFVAFCLFFKKDEAKCVEYLHCIHFLVITHVPASSCPNMDNFFHTIKFNWIEKCGYSMAGICSWN